MVLILAAEDIAEDLANQNSQEEAAATNQLPFMALNDSNESAEGSGSDGTAEDSAGATHSLDGSNENTNTSNPLLVRSRCLLGFSDVLIVS
jgi:hypothetical protein